MRIHKCPFCEGSVRIKKVECSKCSMGFEGDFFTSPIMSLPEEYQSFIELFVLSSGSLKEMAALLGVTYPTVRIRMDNIIKALKEQMQKKEEYKQELINKVDQGKLTPEKAAQIIKNL